MNRVILTILLLSSNSLIAQIWQYPFQPFSYDDYQKTENKVGIKSEIATTKRSDQVIITYLEYDSAGRIKLKTENGGDTIKYFYNENGFWTKKVVGKKEFTRKFQYTSSGKIARIQGNSPDLNIQLTYDSLENIVAVKYDSLAWKECTYFKDSRIKTVKSYSTNLLRDKIEYSYNSDTIRYEFYLYDQTGTKVLTRENTTGIYNKKSKLISVVSIIDEDGTTYKTQLTLEYDKKGRLIKVTDQISNGSIGYALYSYDKKGYLTKTKEFSMNKLVKETTYTYKL